MINITLCWAEAEFPVTIKILNEVKNMSSDQIKAIPGAEPFIKILNHVFRSHMFRQMQTHNNTYFTTTNKIVYNTLNELNLTNFDIPVTNLGWVPNKALNNTYVKTLAETALICRENEMPFVEAVLTLTKNISYLMFDNLKRFTNDLQWHQLTNHTVLHDLGRNISREILPKIKKSFNFTGYKIMNASIGALVNFTKHEIKDLKNYRINLKQIVNNSIVEILNNTKNMISNGFDRAVNLGNTSINMIRDQISDIIDHTSNLPGITINMTTDFDGALNELGNRVANLSNNALNRIGNLTNLTLNTSLSYFDDFNYAKNKAYNLTYDVFINVTAININLMLSTMRNLMNVTAITCKYSPLRLTQFSSFQSLLSNVTQDVRQQLPDIRSTLSSVGDSISTLFNHNELRSTVGDFFKSYLPFYR